VGLAGALEFPKVHPRVLAAETPGVLCQFLGRKLFIEAQVSSTFPSSKK
jgi:hypothetical protein